MASESSSAVLALTDADDDTEALSSVGGLDGADQGAPVIMEHGYDIAVKVDCPMKQLSTLETFVTYRVRCVCARWAQSAPVRRRYNHFKSLHRALCSAHALLAVPPPPPLHSARQQLDRYSPAFVAIRTMALHAFLDRIAKHPILTHSEDFRIFLTTPDDQFEKMYKSENSAMNLWGFGSALYGSAESNRADGPRVQDPEFTAIAEYLVALQHRLGALCSLTTRLCKGNAQLGSQWEHMKRVCDAWSSQSGGLVGRAVVCVAEGAGAAGDARRGTGAVAGRGQALLPLLVGYAAALRDKIRQRDNLHVARVAGNNTNELHNRLEQASEALRADLADWTPKTRSDVKGLLVELANKQVNIHSQTLMAWEHALKISSATNPEELFKTVSKTAVLNLSPSKCRTQLTPTETERDIDDLDNYSNDSDVIQEIAVDLDTSEIEKKEVNGHGCVKLLSDLKTESLDSKFESLDSKTESDESKNSETKLTSKLTRMTDPLQELSKNNSLDSKTESDSSETNMSEPVMMDPLQYFSKVESLDSKTESDESKNSETEIISKPMRIQDPLQDFSDVDLS